MKKRKSRWIKNGRVYIDQHGWARGVLLHDKPTGGWILIGPLGCVETAPLVEKTGDNVEALKKSFEKQMRDTGYE